MKARIVEIFSSLQGEGSRLGERQIFVRFGGCNLRCDYCDEPDTIPMESGRFWEIEEAQAEIARLAAAQKHAALSWTGGEPLLQADFIAAAAPFVRSLGLQTVLETNAVLPERWKRVKAHVDAAAVDIKLPSSIGFSAFSRHAEILRDLPAGSFAKVVATEETLLEEWMQAVALLAETAPQIPLFLQPATPARSLKNPAVSVRPIPPLRAMEFYFLAKERLETVRVLRQMHPLWRLR